MAARYRQKLAKVIKSSPKPRNSTHRPVEDDTDLEAKKRMRSFRVHFTPTEDAAILIVRIVADLLNFDRRKVSSTISLVLSIGPSLIATEIGDAGKNSKI